MLHLELCSKPCLEEVDDVSCGCLRADVPDDLSHSSFQARAEIVKHVLFVPAQVACHALELRQERVKTSGPVVRLELDERMHCLGARRTGYCP